MKRLFFGFVILSAPLLCFAQEVAKLGVGGDGSFLGSSVGFVSLPPPFYGVAIAGAPGDCDFGYDYGEAFIFRPVSGDWTNTTSSRLVPSDPEPSDCFGAAVDLNGLDVVVGSPGRAAAPAGNAAVYVFLNGVAERRVGPSGYASSFGRAVAFSGSSIAVGGSGKVFVYTDTSGGDWSTYSELVIDPTGLVVDFGRSVDLQDSTLVVGADEAIYIYQGLLPTEVLAFDGASGNFGYSVALSGRTIAVGAPQDSNSTGAVYVVRDISQTGDWSSTQQVKIVPGDLVETDVFGVSVALQGSILVVGASKKDYGALNDGGIYIFKDTSPAGDWSMFTQGALYASDGDSDTRLGHAVALGSGMVVAGGDLHSVPPDWKNGVAYIFDTEAVLFSDGFESGNTSAW